MTATISESISTAKDANALDQPPEHAFPSTGASLILAVLLLIPAGWQVWSYAISGPTVDFFGYWAVCRAVSARHTATANIYSPDSQREMGLLAIREARLPTASDSQRQATEIFTQHYNGRIDAPGTPFVFAVVGAILSGNYAVDQKRFVLPCTTCLLLSMLSLMNLLRFSWLEISLLLLFTATDYGPIISDLRVGNVNELQLLSVVLFIFFKARNQPLLGGLTIGAATMFKPTTALVLVLALVAGLADREYRHLARMLLGCLIGIGMSFLWSAAYFGSPGIWIEFLRSLPRTLNGVSYSLQFGNFSLSALLFGATSRISLAIPLLLLGAFSWLLFATRERNAGEHPAVSKGIVTRRMHSAFAVGGGGCAIMLLSSPLVWLHYYLLLLPLSLYVIRPAAVGARNVLGGKIRVRRIAVLVLPFALLFMFSFLTQIITGTHARMMCVLTVTAALGTLTLASYRIWQGRGRFARQEWSTTSGQ